MLFGGDERIISWTAGITTIGKLLGAASSTWTEVPPRTKKGMAIHTKPVISLHAHPVIIVSSTSSTSSTSSMAFGQHTVN
jgi:hypothetical protein